MATEQLQVVQLLVSIRPDQRERFKGRPVRYHGPFIMRANGNIEDLVAEGRPESLKPEVPVLVFRMPDDPGEPISAEAVTVL